MKFESLDQMVTRGKEQKNKEVGKKEGAHLEKFNVDDDDDVNNRDDLIRKFVNLHGIINENEFADKIAELGIEKELVLRWISAGKDYSAEMSGQSEYKYRFIDEDVFFFVRYQFESYLSYIELKKKTDTMSETQKILAENMSTDSGGNQNAMTLDKINAAEKIHNVNLQCESKNPQSIYYGSGDDIEFPMLAELQNITMVDPILDDEQIDNITKRVYKLYSSQAQFDKSTNTLRFSYGNNDFQIKFVGQAMEEFNEQNSENTFDIVMTFNKAPWMTDREIKKCLKEGGYIFDNRKGIYGEDGPDLSNVPDASNY